MTDDPGAAPTIKQGFAASLRAIGLEPIEHFGHVFKRAWSIRFILAAGLFSGFEIALPILDQWIIIPRGVFAGLSAVTTMAACVARLTAQTAMLTPKGDNDAHQ